MPSKAADAGARWYLDSDMEAMRRSAFVRWVVHLHLRFLQGLFQQIPDPSYRWSADQNTTNIVIVDEFPVDLAVYGFKPCLTTALGPYALNSVAFDDMASMDANTNQKRRVFMMAGTMTINCIAEVGQEARDLAAFIVESFIGLRDVLQRAGFCQVARNLQVGAATPAGQLVANDDRKWFACTIYAPFFIHRMVSATPLNAPISRGMELWLQGSSDPTWDWTPAVDPLSQYGRSEAAVSAQWMPASSLPQPGVYVQQQLDEVPSDSADMGEYTSTGGVAPIRVLIDERNS